MVWCKDSSLRENIFQANNVTLLLTLINTVQNCWAELPYSVTIKQQLTAALVWFSVQVNRQRFDFDMQKSATNIQSFNQELDRHSLGSTERAVNDQRLVLIKESWLVLTLKTHQTDLMNSYTLVLISHQLNSYTPKTEQLHCVVLKRTTTVWSQNHE